MKAMSMVLDIGVADEPVCSSNAAKRLMFFFGEGFLYRTAAVAASRSFCRSRCPAE